MALIKTPHDLGYVIRSRRKELGWDQATLAKQIGVTRQWVIDIEKGKPRAELELAMRALNVLGLTLLTEIKEDKQSYKSTKATNTQPRLDINDVVEGSKPTAPGLGNIPGPTLAELLKHSQSKSATEIFKSYSQPGFRDLLKQAQPKTAADKAQPKTASDILKAHPQPSLESLPMSSNSSKLKTNASSPKKKSSTSAARNQAANKKKP